MTIHIILPEYNEDTISENLRQLTAHLANHGADTSAGLLGGEHGYGAYYENDVFMMHPYCWCEQDNCPWCATCTCPDEAHIYIIDGTVVPADKFFGPNRTPGATYTWEKNPNLECDYCTHKAEQAPNFHHKPTNTKIWWYKYIGRGMETDVNGNWDDIINDVYQSLK